MAITKIAVSIDEGLLRRIDAQAEEMQVSRSTLLARAAEDYLRHLESRQMTAQLDKVYGQGEEPEERERRRSMLRKQRKQVEGNW